jgi:hypothetical protein
MKNGRKSTSRLGMMIISFTKGWKSSSFFYFSYLEGSFIQKINEPLPK